MRIFSFSPFGYEGAMVTVEVDLRRGIPAVDLVGLADNAVRESRERMRAAIRNSGFEFPCERVLISLSPADVKKEGAGFDLAIALAVLAAKDGVSLKLSPEQSKSKILIMGELELSGRVRAVRGVHAAICTARENGIKFCIIPAENGCEAAVSGITAVTVSTLEEAFHAFTNFLRGEAQIFAADSRSPTRADDEVRFSEVSPHSDFSAVTGQDFLIRALQIAAAGRHHLMVYGPPGCGKTLCLQRFSSLLPLLTESEKQVSARIYSLAGFSSASDGMAVRPFRSPHQSSSLEGMIGGGVTCLPGEISLAHNGVLFLDEAAEFKSSVLQALRVPLETGTVTLSRAGRHTIFPADFQLLVSLNPCSCGNFGSPDKICVCSTHAVELYWRKFSGPLLDRVDIRVPLFAPSSDLSGSQKNHSSANLRENISRAVFIQRRRQQKSNSRLTPEETAQFCRPDLNAKKLLESAAAEYGFSLRAVSACLKLALTIADMQGFDRINENHMSEAVALRKNEGGLTGFLS